MQQAGPEATKLALALVQSYALTRIAHEVLGESLLQHLQFAFISGGKDFIVQGEKGKDLFLLCHSPVQVLVNGKVVVTMEAPALLGDKALIWPDSTRAATLRVPKGMRALVIKIPMGLFLRDFTFAEIPDASFKREKELYTGIFSEIQRRLFNYIPLQRTQFEALTTTTLNLNAKLIAVNLDKSEDLGWPAEAWNSLPPFLAAKFGYKLPKGVSLTAGTFKDLLYPHFEQKFPRASFKCSDAEYPNRKLTLWNRWLQQVAGQILRFVPQEQLSFSMKGVKLCSPENYRGAIEHLIQTLEGYFPPVKAEITEAKAAQFFTGGEHANDFAIRKYQENLTKNRILKYPNRIQAKLAQTSAKLAAEAENQFNQALAKMKDFSDSIQALSVHGEGGKTGNLDEKSLAAQVDLLTRGFASFNKNIGGGSSKTVVGEAQFDSGVCPTLPDLAKYALTNSIREGMENAFYELAEHLELIKDPLSKDDLQQQLRLVNVLPGYVIPARELALHYWMPVSKGVMLRREKVLVDEVQPGSLLGGKGWAEGEEAATHCLATPERKKEGLVDQSHLFFVLPNLEMNKADLTSDNFATKTLPLWEWIKNRMVKELVNLNKVNAELNDRCMKLDEGLKMQESVAKFEEDKSPLAEAMEHKLLDFLQGAAGMKLIAGGLSPALIAKETQNKLVAQAGKDNPNAKEEEIRNLVYTQFRFLVREMAGIWNPPLEEEENQTESGPTLKMLEEELIAVLEDHAISLPEGAILVTGDDLQLNLPALLDQVRSPEEKRQIFRRVMQVMELRLFKLRLEKKHLTDRYAVVASGNLGNEDEALQKKFLQEQVHKLLKLLQSGLEPVAAAPVEAVAEAS